MGKIVRSRTTRIDFYQFLTERFKILDFPSERVVDCKHGDKVAENALFSRRIGKECEFGTMRSWKRRNQK